MTENSRKIQYLAGVCASLGFLFTGAALSWPSPVLPKFKNNETNVQISDAQSSWMVALVTAGALPGCFIGKILAEQLGRKKTFYASAIPGIIGASIKIFAVVPELLYLARLLEGCTTGMVAVVTMIYITEISDKEVRGALGMLVQVMNNIGSLLMYSIGPFVSYTVLNCIVLAIPITYVLACIWIPESPYYYLQEGRVVSARKEFMKLKRVYDEKWIDEQLDIIRVNVKQNMENKGTLKELLTNLKYRRAIYIIAGLKLLQYLTGALAIQSYLEVIFRQSSSISGPRASIIYGFVQLIAGLAATFLVDRFGRRILLILSSLGVAVSLTAVGAYFFLQDWVQLHPDILSRFGILPLMGILGFNVLYSIGIGNIPYVMQAELFPINVKAIASSTATMTACIFSFIVAKGYQSVKDILGHYAVFWIFASVAFIGIFFVYFFVPETKGKSLEEIQNVQFHVMEYEMEDLNRRNNETREIES